MNSGFKKSSFFFPYNNSLSFKDLILPPAFSKIACPAAVSHSFVGPILDKYLLVH
tara:strand:- start:129 stop:293 length:165 start_codon:yes stop_codon:yes gene_type:complete